MKIGRDPDTDLKVIGAASSQSWHMQGTVFKACGQEFLEVIRTRDGKIVAAVDDVTNGHAIIVAIDALPIYINAYLDAVRALQHIRRYWNKDKSPESMSDALAEILVTVEEVLGE